VDFGALVSKKKHPEKPLKQGAKHISPD